MNQSSGYGLDELALCAAAAAAANNAPANEHFYRNMSNSNSGGLPNNGVGLLLQTTVNSNGTPDSPTTPARTRSNGSSSSNYSSSSSYDYLFASKANGATESPHQQKQQQQQHRSVEPIGKPKQLHKLKQQQSTVNNGMYNPIMTESELTAQLFSAGASMNQSNW
jgi:hypothetical protein